MRDGVSDPKNLHQGWAALKEGKWEEARSVFAAVAGESASPEADEGLSWAAWWLDDAQTVLEARERAFHGYQQRHDSASAARMATWLAADHLDFNGAIATANGWLERAGRLVEATSGSVEQGWLAFHRGFVESVRGNASAAEQLGLQAAELGRHARVVDLEMLGLALQGVSLVSQAEVARGMRCLDEASAFALTGEVTIPISRAWTCCFMVTACTRILDFDRAFEWCERIFQFAEQYGSRYMLGFCRAEYATIELWRGRWSEAEQSLQASLEAFSASRPAMTSGPLVGLAELRRRQGRMREAEELLERAGASNAVQLCRARIALDGDNPQLAVELAERVERKLSPEKPLERAPALELLAHAHLARGATPLAIAARDSLRELARIAGTPGLSARVGVVDGLLSVAEERLDQAKLCLEDAIDTFDRCQAIFDAACARVELATVLLSLGRKMDARREALVARERLQGLGAGVALERVQRLLEPASRAPTTSGVTLSSRELEVLGLLSEGLINRDIAKRLTISEHTVHRHVTSILRKLHVSSRTAAVAWALKSGFVDP